MSSVSSSLLGTKLKVMTQLVTAVGEALRVTVVAVKDDTVTGDDTGMHVPVTVVVAPLIRPAVDGTVIVYGLDVIAVVVAVVLK